MLSHQLNWRIIYFRSSIIFSVPVQKAEQILVDKTKRIIREERLKVQNSAKYFRSVTDNVLIRNHHEIRHHIRLLFQQSNVFFVRERQSHTSFMYRFHGGTRSFCNSCKQQIRQMLSGFRKDINGRLGRERNDVANILRSVANMHPENVLKRGYSITRVNGRAITAVSEVKNSDTLQTMLLDGSIISVVKSISKTDKI